MLDRAACTGQMEVNTVSKPALDHVKCRSWNEDPADNHDQCAIITPIVTAIQARSDSSEAAKLYDFDMFCD